MKAHRFLFTLWGLLLLWVALFTLLHLATTDPILRKFDCHPTLKTLLSGLRRDPTNAVLLDGAGRVIAVSDTDLRWAVGKDAAVTIETGLAERTKRINDLRDRMVDEALLEFRVKLSGGVGANQGMKDLMTELEKSADTNNFRAAAAQFTRLIEGWSDVTRKKVGDTAIFELNYGLEQLAQLKQNQVDAVANLYPPRMHQIFWTSPVGALTEAVLWSFIGTLLNLIVNVSQARSRGKYRSDEQWVSWSKLIYGPVLSFVLILAIYFGIVNAGTEIRFWLLPLLGFLFGYNTRKVAMVIDSLSEKLLGTVAKSVDSDAWQGRAATEAAANVASTAQPKNIDQLKQQAAHVSDSAIVASVIKQQNNL